MSAAVERVATVRERIVDEARSWVGVPYAANGRTRSGIDCVGLLWVVYGAVLGPLDDFADYGASPAPGAVFAGLRLYGERTSFASALPGDVLVMTNDSGKSAHVAIATGDTEVAGVIHAAIFAGRVVEHGLGLAKISGAFRLRGVPPCL